MTFIIISIISVLLAIAALISATETAITATSPGKIQKLRIEGNKKAQLVLNILKIKDKVISTLLIGNSIANTLCTTIATSLFIEFFGDDMGTIISSIVMSFMIIVFSEVVPKAIAVAKAENLALIAAPILKIFLKIFQPVNIMLLYVVKAFCFVFRINLTSQISGTEEVRGFIEHHLHEGNVYKDDRDMLGSILDIRKMLIEDVMVHRSNIHSIDINLSNSEIINLALSYPYTRIPIWENSQDNIIGFIHVRDLLSKLYQHSGHPDEINMRELLNTPWFVPNNASLINQLQAFRSKQSHLAVVIDEYGDLQGIVTLEDILEEIVGQIDDEYDKNSSNIIKKSDTEYIINGTISIRDINRELSWNLPESDFTTLAGYIIHEMQHIPNQGESIQIDSFKFTVLKKIGHTIKTLKVERKYDEAA